MLIKRSGKHGIALGETTNETIFQPLHGQNAHDLLGAEGNIDQPPLPVSSVVSAMVLGLPMPGDATRGCLGR